MNATTDARRNSEGYMDLTAFEALKRAERRRFGYRPLVYICSPYSGDVEANIAVARELLFPQFMNDHHPAERELAMFFNRILLAHCEAVWVYADHVSTGMLQELDWAHALGLPVKYFTTDFKKERP